MSRKAFFLISLVVALSMVITACGGTGTSSSKTFNVGLVTDVGKLNDKSFNQSTWEGVQLAQKDLGTNVQIKYIETTDPKDYDKNIATFADAGYDAIVTVGFLMTDPTYNAAKKYPKVKFIGVDQFLSKDDTHKDWPLPNLVGVVFEEDKAGYLAGALAGYMSKSGVIGEVLGTDIIPPVWRYGEGYKAGAKSVNPSINVIAVYHNDVGVDKTFVDPEWGKTTALSMIDKKADVIFGAGGITGNGALQGVAQKSGTMCIGVDSDQYDTVPEAKSCLISSAMKLLTPSTSDMVKSVKNNTFKSGIFTGPVGLAPYHDFDSKVPADVKTKITQLEKDLASGKVKTNVSPAKP